MPNDKETKYEINHELLQQALNVIANSVCDIKIGDVINVIDKLRQLKPIKNESEGK